MDYNLYSSIQVGNKFQCCCMNSMPEPMNPFGIEFIELQLTDSSILKNKKFKHESSRFS